jgi:la-related protein 1
VNDYGVAPYSPYLYSPVFDPSIPILKAQIEYYFSVENLCKDHYLRQNMDGQGFVHLSTIAGFKRMKAITEDIEMIRFACSLSDQIEFGIGGDGIERLRSRENWKLFVLPVNDRLEAYRNDGPLNWTSYEVQDPQYAAFPAPFVPQAYPTSAGAYTAFPQEQMFQPPYVNGTHYEPVVNGGMNGHRYGQDSRLSAGVPEYAPPEAPVTLESMTNFSDSQVENLMMILSYEEKDDAGSAGAAGVAGYVSDRHRVPGNDALSGSQAQK